MIFVAEKYRPFYDFSVFSPEMSAFSCFVQELFGMLPYFCRKNYTLKVKIVNRSPHPLPKYETIGSAGMDLRANLGYSITLQPLERSLIPTGLFIELPDGYEAQIRPRSGLAIKRGLTMLNSPGTIDSDYRGEIKCIVVNLSNEAQTIEPGERIAQMVIAKYEQIQWEAVETLEETARGEGGFGSTGVTG
jgi:dUTP pyrophosphatase